MRESVRLGRIAGVPVGINWSVLVIFVLITLGLAAGRFPLLYPNLHPVVYGVAGLTAGLVFFLSLLAHEVAHAVVARRHGVGVEGITLWLFGGVARLSGEAPDPGAELRIAGVGPLVSVVLAGAFYAVAVVVDAAGAPGIAVGVFTWLALINLVLAAFNLVPAAPLDGGRLLRAVLWRRHGDRQRAAVTAANAGRAFGWLLVAAGLWLFVAFVGIGGLWFMLIGWFLITAANAEAQHARVQAAFADVRVRDVMAPDPVVAPPSISIAEFLDGYVFRNRFSTFPLTTADGRLVGLVTLNRVKRVPPAQRDTTTLAQVACPPSEVATAAPDEPLADLLPRLAQCSDGRAVVVEHERVVGVVSPSDVARQVMIADLRRAPDPYAQHI
jgi:Zn-dependent protease/CBS domain-containing protein